MISKEMFDLLTKDLHDKMDAISADLAVVRAVLADHGQKSELGHGGTADALKGHKEASEALHKAHKDLTETIHAKLIELCNKTDDDDEDDSAGEEKPGSKFYSAALSGISQLSKNLKEKKG